jgi:hypothetical protein
MPIALVVLASISCTAQRMALENDGHVGQSAVRTCERQQQHPRRTWTRPLRARGTTCRHEGRPAPRAVVFFVVIWQNLSNHGLTRLKRFVPTFTDKLCN